MDDARAEVLGSPWRTVLGIHGRADRSGHELPFAIMLRVDDRDVLVTNHDPSGRAHPLALNASEFALVCAGAELERTNATHFREVVARLSRMQRPLVWSTWFEPGGGFGPEIAGRWTLAQVLTRIGAELVEVRVVERGGAEGERAA